MQKQTRAAVYAVERTVGCDLGVATVTRAVKGFRHKPKFEPIWKQLQEKLKGDEQLFSAVMEGV